ncbi:MAG: hypothetical protein WCG25_05560 [bacterium]
MVVCVVLFLLINQFPAPFIIDISESTLPQVSFAFSRSSYVGRSCS